MSTNVNFYQAIETSDQITIFVPPEEFEAHELGAVYDAELYTTDQALILRLHTPTGDFMATNLAVRESIIAGKPVCISHLHGRLGYVLDQCRLMFTMLN